MGDSCVLRGEPSKSVIELVSSGGVGRMLLTERRTGAEEAMIQFGEAFKEMYPDKRIHITDSVETLENVEGNVFYWGNPRDEGFRTWLSSLKDDRMVFSIIELCHQVSAISRER